MAAGAGYGELTDRERVTHELPPPGVENEPQLVATVLELFDRAARRDLSHHTFYNQVTANVIGRQWYEIDPITGAGSDMVSDDDVTLLTFNRLLPMAMKEAASLTYRTIPCSAVPAGEDEKAIAAARVDQRLWEDYWVKAGMRDQCARANAIKVLLGEVWWDPTFDPCAGELVKEATKEDQLHEFEGDVTVRLRTPYSVFANRGARNIDECRWLACRTMDDIGWLENRYKRGTQIIPEQADPSMYVEYRLQNLISQMNYPGTIRADDDDAFFHHASRIRFWWWPTRRYPKGREIHIAGNIVLYDGDWTQGFTARGSKRRYPMMPDYYFKLEHRMKGVGFVENLLQPQWDYNRTRTQEAHARKKMGNPKWLTPRKAKMSDPDESAGQVISYDIPLEAPSAKPEWSSPNVNADIFDKAALSRILDMQDIGSQHEVSNAQTPPGVHSGIAIQSLQAADEVGKNLPTSSHLTAVEWTANAVLSLFRLLGPDTINIATLGENFQHEFASWKKGDSLAACRIQMRSDLGLPASPEEQRVRLIQLIELGALDPVQHRTAILTQFEFPNLALALHDANIHVAVAERENAIMASSNTVPDVKQEDDHHLHIETHTRPIVLNREMDPEAEARHRLHNAMHLFWITQKQQEDARLIDAAGGGATLDDAGERVGDEVDKDDEMASRGQRPPVPKAANGAGDDKGKAQAGRSAKRPKGSAPSSSVPQ